MACAISVILKGDADVGVRPSFGAPVVASRDQELKIGKVGDGNALQTGQRQSSTAGNKMNYLNAPTQAGVLMVL
jgi:hypothetical protein